MRTMTSDEQLIATAMNVTAVRLADCGCDQPRAGMTFRRTAPDRAEVRWEQCANCHGWPSLTVEQA